MALSRRSVFVALALAVGLTVVGGLRVAAGPQVDGLTPTRQPLTETLLVNGRTAWPRRAELGLSVPGSVAEVSAVEGARVEAGTLLVRLYDGEAAARAREAEASVSEARARLGRLRSVGHPAAAQQLERAQLQADEADRDLARREALHGAGGITDADLEAARERRDRTASLLASATLEMAATDRGGADTVAAAAQLSRAQASSDAAQAAVSLTQLRAPTAGQVLERRVEPGQIVRPGDTLVVFSGADALQVEVTPDEVHLGRLAVGQAAMVRVEAFADEVLAAQVSEVAPQVDPGRGTVRVRLALDAPAPGWLRPDMTATVEIVLGDRPDALVLPVTHVQGLGGAAPWVLAVEAGRATRRAVTLGAQDDHAVEVLDGLAEGDVVLAADAAPEGARVRVGEVAPALPPAGR